MADDSLIKLEDAIPPDYHVRPGFFLKAGWELLKQNLAGFIGFTVVALIVMFVLNTMAGVGQVLAYIVGPALWAGFIIVSLKTLLGQPTVANDFTLGFQFVLPLLLYSVVSSIFISVGFVLLIIPGLYLLVGYMFCTWLIVDRRLDFWQAMEFSRKTVHKHFFEVFGFFLLLALINLGGLLLFGLGLLLTVPWTLCALTIAYREIFGLQSSSF